MKFGPVRPRRTGTVRYSSVQNRRVKGDVQMEFSEFAGLLYPIIGGGDTTGRFTRKLFEKITDIPVSLFQVVQIAWQIADGDTFERAGRRTRLDLVRIAIRG